MTIIQVAYLCTYAATLLLIWYGIRKVGLTDGTKSAITYWGLHTIWFLYLYNLMMGGLISDRTEAWRFPVFVVIPIAAIVTYLLVWQKRKSVHLSVPKSWPIYFQSFRIVIELLLFATYNASILPVETTFLGYNFELYFALTAPFIAYLGITKGRLPKSILILWNATGLLLLAVIVSIIATMTLRPSLWGYDYPIVDTTFTELPMFLLPALIVPTAVWMHIFSIIQLRSTK